MILMIENGIRGGISQVCGDRYKDINGKNHVVNSEIDKDSLYQEYLMYLDANNLYGYAMKQKLSISDFKWVEDMIEIDKKIRNNEITGDEDYGYILNVDLKINKDKRFNNLPLAPENKAIPNEKLSQYTKDLIENSQRTPNKKLILDFEDKQDYCIHIKNLILYHKLGCEFKINDVISFKQSNWLGKYIDFNTDIRTKATNDFEKDFFKLMNNSVFGKTMENVRKHVDIKLADNCKNASYYIRKSTYKTLHPFSDTLVAIHMKKDKIKFNMLIYIVFYVLELSKHLMYETYYDKLQNIFTDMQLLYFDTDSYILHIRDKNIFKIMKENEHLFDFSDYPEKHVLYSTKNKKVV